jgi:hypothetical protein
VREIDRIEGKLVEIEGILAEGDAAVAVRVSSVSGWSVAQQIDHTLMVVERSLARLLERPAPLARGLTLTGRVVLTLGWFPRGSARAPRGFEGREIPSAELAARLAGVRASLARLAAEPELLARPEPVVPHPYFGGLDARRALRNAVVHTEHHLAIVRDLRRAAARG